MDFAPARPGDVGLPCDRAMWIAVAISAVWGPDFVSTSGGGTTSTTIPAAIGVALFAFIGSWAVAVRLPP